MYDKFKIYYFSMPLLVVMKFRRSCNPTIYPINRAIYRSYSLFTYFLILLSNSPFSLRAN
ncbi:MAG: hypothetical protein EBX41_05930 [Chitinophagia bacterium]|nr:hypothetical protein [Chitinophagia bacterium]